MLCKALKFHVMIECALSLIAAFYCRGTHATGICGMWSMELFQSLKMELFSILTTPVKIPGWLYLLQSRDHRCGAYQPNPDPLHGKRKSDNMAFMSGRAGAGFRRLTLSFEKKD
jgi:hypothetical protein